MLRRTNSIATILLLWLVCYDNSEVYAQGFFPIHWTNASSNLEVIAATNSLSHSGSSSAGYIAGARSVESFPHNGNGKVRFRVGDSNTRSPFRAFSLSTVDANYSYLEMDFSVLLTGTKISAYRKGVLLAQTNMTTGFVSIEKIGAEVKFYANAICFATAAVSAQNVLPYFVDTSLRGVSQWEGIEVDFPILYPIEVMSVSQGAINLSDNKLTKTGTDPLLFVGKNAFETDQAESVVYINDIGSLQQESWAFGFAKDPDLNSPLDWSIAVVFNATCDAIRFFMDGSLISTSTIADGTMVQIQFLGDRVKLLLNGTQISERVKILNGPFVFKISTGQGAGNSIALNKFYSSIGPLKTARLTVQEVDAQNPGLVSLTPIGVPVADVEYCWSEVYYSRAQWQSELATLPEELKAEVEQYSYDELFGTSMTQSSVEESLSSKCFMVDKSANTVKELSYRMPYKAEIANISNYSFNDNTLVRTGSGTLKFDLHNGVVIGSTEGEVEFQPVDFRGASMLFGLMTVSTSAVINAFNSVSIQIGISGFTSININGVSTSIGHAIPGDKYKIVVSGANVSVFRNNVLMRSGVLPTGGVWRVAAHIAIAGPSTFIKLTHSSMNHVSKPKKIRPIVNHVSCNGDNLGSVSLNVSPITGFSSVNYTLAGAAYNQTNTTGAFTGLTPGSYTFSFNGVSYPLLIGYQVPLETQTNGIQLTAVNNGVTNILPAGWDKASSINQWYIPSEGWIEWDQNKVSSGYTRVYLKNEESYSFSGFMTLYSSNKVIKRGPNNSCVNILSNAFSQSANADATFRISWTPTLITYSFNGNVIGLDPCNGVISSDLFQLIIRMFGNSGQAVKNVRSSFKCPVEFLQYATLNKEISGSCYRTFEGKLYVKYDNQYVVNSTDQLVFKIYDKAHNAVVDNSSFTILPITLGHNEVVLDLGTESLNMNEVYLLEVLNQKNEKFYLKFKYQ